MNRIIYLFAVLGTILFASCGKEIDDIEYTPNIKIQFAAGGDSSIVVVPKGTTDYAVKVEVSANSSPIRLFEIYSADPKTGNRISQLMSQAFTTDQKTYSSSYTVTGLTDNKVLKVVVTDGAQQSYEKNLFIKITPAVIFSNSVQIETVENYYGPYFANWLSGRVYMRNTPYADQIDISLGDVAIPAGATTKSPALVNPAQRSANGLLTASGLQSTKYALTTLTTANYNAITKIDATPISSLADPTLDVVALQSGKVYLFKTANGKKGLISVTSIAAKTGTIENVNGKWEPSIAYSEVTLSTKFIAK